MQKILKVAFLFVLAGAIISCKKSNSSSGYYFKGNYSGTAKTFNTSVVAAKSNLGSGTYNLSIVGTSGTEESGIVLWSDQDNFTAGSTYSVSALNGTTENSLSFVSPMGSSAPSSMWSTSYDYGVVTESFSCTITEATSAYVKGTFSGVLYMTTDSAVVTKNVDSGEFYAKF